MGDMAHQSKAAMVLLREAMDLHKAATELLHQALPTVPLRQVNRTDHLQANHMGHRRPVRLMGLLQVHRMVHQHHLQV